MIPVANHLPLRTRKPRRVQPRQMLIGFLIGSCAVLGFLAAAQVLARK